MQHHDHRTQLEKDRDIVKMWMRCRIAENRNCSPDAIDIADPETLPAWDRIHDDLNSGKPELNMPASEALKYLFAYADGLSDGHFIPHAQN
jgi:hypothetical protein